MAAISKEAFRRPRPTEPTFCHLIGRLSASLLINLFASVGCASLPPAERQLLIDASRQYTQGDITTATANLDRIIREYSNASETAEAYYLRGLCRFISKQLQAAGEDFDRGISTSTRSDLTARCRASLAAIAYQSQDWPRAARLYQQSVGELPDVPPMDAVLYAAGVSMQRAGEWQEAKLQFARLLNRFRNSPLAADARRMATWRHPYYSIQLGVYRDAENAGKAVQEFRLQGFDPVQEYLSRNGEDVWVVMSGRYRTYADATAALAAVRQRGYDAVIIP